MSKGLQPGDRVWTTNGSAVVVETVVDGHALRVELEDGTTRVVWPGERTPPRPGTSRAGLVLTARWQAQEDGAVVLYDDAGVARTYRPVCSKAGVVYEPEHPVTTLSVELRESAARILIETTRLRHMTGSRRGAAWRLLNGIVTGIEQGATALRGLSVPLTKAEQALGTPGLDRSQLAEHIETPEAPDARL